MFIYKQKTRLQADVSCNQMIASVSSNFGTTQCKLANCFLLPRVDTDRLSLFGFQVASSFGSDPFSGETPAVKQAPAATEPLKKPPRWMRRPCAATFAVSSVLLPQFFSFLELFLN